MDIKLKSFDELMKANSAPEKRNYNQACDQLANVMAMLSEWNSYEHDIHDHITSAHFEIPEQEGPYPDSFVELAKQLHNLFWSFAQVASAGYHFGDEWIVWFDELQYAKLFEIGCLYEKLEILLTAQYGKDYKYRNKTKRTSVLDVTQSDLDKFEEYEDKYENFQQSGTAGVTKKYSARIKAIEKYIQNEYNGDISEIKIGVLTHKIHKAANEVAKAIKAEGKESKTVCNHPFSYLSAIIHPSYDKNGNPLSSNQAGTVLSSGRIQKIIRKTQE